MGYTNYYNYLVVTFVALGSFTYGFNSAIMGLVIGLPEFFRYFNINLDDDTGSSITGATNGLYSGGGAIGCIFVPWLLGAVGRRKTIQIGSVVAIISAALQSGSVHIAMFLLARFLNGVAVGMLNTSIPVFQSEVSLAQERGRMVGTHGVLVVTGYSVAGFAGFGTYYARPEITWRLCLALQIVAPLLLMLGSPWLPESPRWLALKGRHQEAYTTLKALHARGENSSDQVAKAEFCQIVQQLQFERATAAPNSWISIFKAPSYRKRLLLGFGVQFIAQSTGVLVVNNYQVLLYNSLGISGSLPLLLNGVYNGMAAFMNWINSLFLDRLGRIRIMLIGLTGCVCSLIGLTAIIAEFSGTSNRIGNGFGVFFLFLFVFFYGGTMDATSYVYCAEIFPTSVRAQGNGFSVAGLFTATLIYTQVAPTAFAKIGWRYYLVFIIIPTIGALFMWRFFPETKTLSLEEISGLFGDDVASDITQLSERERTGFDSTLEEILDSVLGTASTPPQGLPGKDIGLKNVHIERTKDSGNDVV
ncbi:general substrate transporter [Aaosphaeria arxii CBS 175.79]|uniref:General substrate transporter n=1 Tax=Aaosphaeria arxii CBS 175.79 TaxID=1450172 RepID=A0A6A5X950_9PLEO|nr:general substrate transporter [Aaosphaeria arxii CBS 175.79]KAF2009416.1 general substrate transporter [Aaosphaeria arxii CBS 175.79]